MDHRSARDKDIEVDLESGLPLIEDNSIRISNSSSKKHGKLFVAKISGRFVAGEEGTSSYFNESNLGEVSLDVMKAINKTPAKEKHKKASSKKAAAKPPRSPQGPSLDAADHKLIRELSELAMLKRARIERMKALKKMKNSAKPATSNSSSFLAMIFTVIFFIVIIFHGMSSGKSSVASSQGYSVSGGDGSLISVQYQLNPSSESNAPGSESPNFVQRVAGSDLDEKMKRN